MAEPRGISSTLYQQAENRIFVIYPSPAAAGAPLKEKVKVKCRFALQKRQLQGR